MRSTIAFSLFVAAGSSVLALTAPPPADAVAAKVTLCHIPPGNPDERHTIVVGGSAVDAHLEHGDQYGACPPTCSSASHCDDGDLCTQDVCEAGSCSHLATDCNDSDECTVDSCVANKGCVYQASTEPVCTDRDYDGISDAEDNCPTMYNPDQDPEACYCPCFTAEDIDTIPPREAPTYCLDDPAYIEMFRGIDSVEYDFTDNLLSAYCASTFDGHSTSSPTSYYDSPTCALLILGSDLWQQCPPS